jgi:hypothetical protein
MKRPGRRQILQYIPTAGRIGSASGGHEQAGGSDEVAGMGSQDDDAEQAIEKEP